MATIRQEAAFVARRARLLSGMTQMEFAAKMGVEDTTVSRWENGKLKPKPSAYVRLREMILRAGGPLSDEAIKRSHLLKFVSWMNDLARPKMVSRGVAEALMQAGIMPDQLTPNFWVEAAHDDPQFDASVVNALGLIQADKQWLLGHIAFAEAHAFALKIKKWVNLMVSPLSDGTSALIEASVARPSSAQDGFWVRLINPSDLVYSRKLL